MKKKDVADIYRQDRLSVKFFYISAIFLIFIAPLLILVLYSSFGPPLLDNFAGGRASATYEQREAGKSILYFVNPSLAIIGVTALLWSFVTIYRRFISSKAKLAGHVSLLLIAIVAAGIMALWPYIV